MLQHNGVLMQECAPNTSICYICTLYGQVDAHRENPMQISKSQREKLLLVVKSKGKLHPKNTCYPTIGNIVRKSTKVGFPGSLVPGSSSGLCSMFKDDRKSEHILKTHRPSNQEYSIFLGMGNLNVSLQQQNQPQRISPSIWVIEPLKIHLYLYGKCEHIATLLEYLGTYCMFASYNCNPYQSELYMMK